MIQDAFDHDPLYKYLRKTPVSRFNETPAVRTAHEHPQDADPEHPDTAPRRFIVYLDILYHVHYQGAFTINHGDGCVTLYAWPILHMSPDLQLIRWLQCTSGPEHDGTRRAVDLRAARGCGLQVYGHAGAGQGDF